MILDRCYFCKRMFGLLEESYSVIKAVASPSTKDRWKVIGKCCSMCYYTNSIVIDPWKTERL